MSLPPAVVDAMVASGCTVEQLAAAVKAAAFAEEMARAEAERIRAEHEANAEAARRLKNAEKMRRYRERNRPLPDVTVTAGNEPEQEATPNPLPPCPPAFPPDPHTTPLNPPIPATDGAGASPKSTGPPAKKACRLPADWQLSAEDRAAGLKEGLPDDEISRIADDFRDYWHAKSGSGGVKLDWPATWRRWIREHVRRHGAGGFSAGNRGGGTASGPAGGGRQPPSLLAALAETARDMGRHG